MKSITVLLASLFLAASILISSCSTTNTPTEEPVEVNSLTITFQPESCIYDGPKVIKKGKVTITYENLSENTLIHGVFFIPDGKTYQDFEEHIQREEVNNEKPNWSELQGGSVVISDPRAKEYELDKGLYALVCGEILPTGGWINWLASPLEVR